MPKLTQGNFTLFTVVVLMSAIFFVVHVQCEEVTLNVSYQIDGSSELPISNQACADDLICQTLPQAFSVMLKSKEYTEFVSSLNGTKQGVVKVTFVLLSEIMDMCSIIGGNSKIFYEFNLVTDENYDGSEKIQVSCMMLKLPPSVRLVTFSDLHLVNFHANGNPKSWTFRNSLIHDSGDYI